MSDYLDHPDPRHNLPSRRISETVKVTTDQDQSIYLTIGFDPADPERPREVFYSAGFRSGSQMEFLVQDACVLISLLLQHGHTTDDIAKSLAREEKPGGEMAYASVIGLILQELKTTSRTPEGLDPSRS